MADFDEELRQDAEENAREAEYIMEQLPTELKEKFSTADLLAWTVVIIIVSVLFDRLFSWAVHRIQRRLETM